MTAEAGFVSSLALTLALLAGVVATGLRARRRLHLALVGATLLALGATIAFAERMGAHYDLAAAGAITPVHHFLAKATTLAYLAPLTSGLLTLRDPRWRPRHRACAFTVLALTVITAVTGTWMLLAAERLDPSSAGADHRPASARQELGDQPRHEEQAAVREQRHEREQDPRAPGA
jgi:hypothetical protein